METLLRHLPLLNTSLQILYSYLENLQMQVANAKIQIYKLQLELMIRL